MKVKKMVVNSLLFLGIAFSTVACSSDNVVGPGEVSPPASSSVQPTSDNENTEPKSDSSEMIDYPYMVEAQMIIPKDGKGYCKVTYRNQGESEINVNADVQYTILDQDIAVQQSDRVLSIKPWTAKVSKVYPLGEPTEVADGTDCYISNALAEVL